MKNGSHISQLVAPTVRIADQEDGTQLPRIWLGTKEMTATYRSKDRSPFRLGYSNDAADQTEQHCLASIQTA